MVLSLGPRMGCSVLPGSSSRGDWLLSFVYRTSSAQLNVAGLQPIGLDDRRMVNVDLSSVVSAGPAAACRDWPSAWPGHCCWPALTGVFFFGGGLPPGRAPISTLWLLLQTVSLATASFRNSRAD